MPRDLRQYERMERQIRRAALFGTGSLDIETFGRELERLGRGHTIHRYPAAVHGRVG